MKKHGTLVQAGATFLLALVFCVCATVIAHAEERHVKDIIYAATAQPDFILQKKNQCPAGTVFTTESNKKTYCRVCPEGYTYYAELKWCAKCPPGKKFEPPYQRAGEKWGVFGLCVEYK